RRPGLPVRVGLCRNSVFRPADKGFFSASRPFWESFAKNGQMPSWSISTSGNDLCHNAGYLRGRGGEGPGRTFSLDTLSSTDLAACSVPFRSLRASTTNGWVVGFTHGSQ